MKKPLFLPLDRGRSEQNVVVNGFLRAIANERTRDAVEICRSIWRRSVEEEGEERAGEEEEEEEEEKKKKSERTGHEENEEADENRAKRTDFLGGGGGSYAKKKRRRGGGRERVVGNEGDLGRRMRCDF